MMRSTLRWRRRGEDIQFCEDQLHNWIGMETATLVEDMQHEVRRVRNSELARSDAPIQSCRRDEDHKVRDESRRKVRWLQQGT
jgi:hypothetical protein